MRIQLVIFKYFPTGGAQRDLFGIGAELARRGHAVEIVCGEWQGPRPEWAQVTVLPVRGWSNHARARALARRLDAELPRSDRRVGFNRMPGLDVCFAADNCYAARAPWWSAATGRGRTWREFEEAVFAPAAKTRILALTERQRDEYQKTYGTPSERFRILPPGVGPEFHPVSRHGAMPYRGLLLAADFRVKGADRAIEALAAQPDGRFRLHLAGDARHAAELRALAERRGVGAAVEFSGPVGNPAEAYESADFLIHPARREAAGNVIAEAVATGLPVIVSGECGYAPLAAEAGGTALPEPFASADLAKALNAFADDFERYRERAEQYAAQREWPSRTTAAAEFIEA